MLEGTGPEPKAAPSAWQAALTALARCIRFFSRLPVPRLPFEADPHAAPDPSAMVRALPFAGLVIGLPSVLVLAASLALGLDPWLCATLSIAALAVSTGAMHEDGLADLADSFGGATRERKLAIMKDSLVGSYGVCALILAFLLRIGALAALADRLDALPLCLGFLAACSLSRIAGVAPLAFLPPARADGLSRGVGQPSRDSFWIGAILGACLTIALGFLSGLPKAGIGLMLIAAALAGGFVTQLSRRLFGGQTGDVAGAGQQAAEIAVWLALLIAVTP